MRNSISQSIKIILVILVALNLGEDHKTVANIRKRNAFTLSVPSIDTLKESDFFGIASANKMNDKFERSGLHAVKSEKVDAPIITEYPLTMECTVEKFEDEPYGLRILGRIINTLADESVLDEKGNVDAEKLHTFAFDQMQNGYYAVGKKVGKAWNAGAELMKK